jgi:hypothetical protein
MSWLFYDEQECDCDHCGLDELEDGLAPGEGGWYSRFAPQPIDVIEAWGLDHHQAEIITYLVRHDMKNGREDLEKAMWYLQRYIDWKYPD